MIMTLLRSLFTLNLSCFFYDYHYYIYSFYFHEYIRLSYRTVVTVLCTCTLLVFHEFFTIQRRKMMFEFSC